ncbi:MAG: TonB-dependent receptor [Muribaculaceae bacterium]|nr:TonB-dependent receptor [Muribaculaceae bacterium]
MRSKIFCTVLTFSGCLCAGLTPLQAVEHTDSVVSLRGVEIVSSQDKRVTILPYGVDEKFLPVNMTRVDNSTLENRGIVDIVGATRFLPSVKTRTTYGGFQEFYIRGFSNQLVATDGVADQRSFITSMPMHDLSNVESIELLRGPASALYGQSVVGGVLNITRRQPTAERHLYTRLGLSSWHGREAMFGMSGKLVGPFNYYASAYTSSTDGWRSNMERRLSLYGTISGWFTARDFLQLTYYFANDRYGTDTGLPTLMPYNIYSTDGKLYLSQFQQLPGLNRKARYNNESDFLINRTQDVQLRYEHVFSPAVKLRDVAMFRYDNINYQSTESMSYLTSDEPIYKHYYERDGKKTYINLDTLTNSSPLAFNHVAYHYSNQLELTGDFYTGSVKHTYFGGYAVNYLHRPSFGGGKFSGPGVDSRIPVYHPYSCGAMFATLSRVSISDRLSQSVYLSDVVDVCKEFKFMLSGRYDYYKYRSAVVQLKDGDRNYTHPTGSDYSSIVNHALSYRAGVVYLPVQELSVYASVGSFFKPNNTVYNDNTVYIDADGKRYYPNDGGEVFSPEKGYQVEGGIKYDWNGFTANASYFYIHKNNVVTSLGTLEEDNVVKTVRGQVGRMHSQGVDVDLSYSWRDFLFSAGYAYTNARVGKIAPNDYVQVNTDRGNHYTYIPENQFFFTGDYEVSQGPVKGLGAALSLTYQDAVYTNLANGIKLDSFFLTDIALRYKMHCGVEYKVAVNNLFNRHYNVSCLGNQMIPGQDINWKVSVGYSF